MALVADELVNPAPHGFDGMAVLADEGWGAMVLPPSALSDDVAAPLLEQIAEQVAEFARNGYALVVVGGRDGLEAALRGASVVPAPCGIRPASSEELRAFLRSQPVPSAETDVR